MALKIYEDLDVNTLIIKYYSRYFRNEFCKNLTISFFQKFPRQQYIIKKKIIIKYDLVLLKHI